MRNTTRALVGVVAVLGLCGVARANILEVHAITATTAGGVTPYIGPYVEGGSSSANPGGQIIDVGYGSVITFGVYVDLTASSTSNATALAMGLGAYSISVRTGDGTATGNGRERYGVTYTASTHVLTAGSGTAYTAPSATDSVLQAVSSGSTGYNGGGVTNMSPTDFSDLLGFSGTYGAVSSSYSPSDSDINNVAFAGSQGSANGWVIGFATTGGVTAATTAPGYTAGQYAGQQLLFETQYTTVSSANNASEPLSRSVQVNSFYSSSSGASGGALIKSMNATGTGVAAFDLVNNNYQINTPNALGSIGAPVTVVVNTPPPPVNGGNCDNLNSRISFTGTQAAADQVTYTAGANAYAMPTPSVVNGLTNAVDATHPSNVATIGGASGTGNSTAQILWSSVVSGSGTLNMDWRARTFGETSGTATNPPMYPSPNTATDGLASDVVKISGMAAVTGGGTIGTVIHQTDAYVLQMGYSLTELKNMIPALKAGTETEAQAAANKQIGLAYLNPGANGTWESGSTGDDLWKNAAYDNLGTFQPVFEGAVGWNNTFTTPGEWGVDPVNHLAWAVVNHDGQFAVVPEPSALALLGAGLAGLLAYGLRRRHAKR